MDEEFKKYIGMHLKISRIRAGLTQQQVAARLGMSENMLSKIETGRYVPHEELITKLQSLYEPTLEGIKKESATCLQI